MTDLDETPGVWDCCIDGTGYVLDLGSQAFVGPVSVPMQRIQQTQDTTGEGSLSTDGAWRRTITSWHHGAGQRYYDQRDSDPYRFDTSLGVDIWTPGELAPLPDSNIHFWDVGAGATLTPPTFGTSASGQQGWRLAYLYS